MITHSDPCAKQLSVSGVGLDTNLTPTPLLTDHMHVKNGHKSVPSLLGYLIIVCIVKNQKTRLLLLVSLKYRQINFHRQGVGLNVLDDSVKLGIVNVNVRNLHGHCVS